MVMNWWEDPEFNVIEMNWDSVLALVWNCFCMVALLMDKVYHLALLLYSCFEIVMSFRGRDYN